MHIRFVYPLCNPTPTLGVQQLHLVFEKQSGDETIQKRVVDRTYVIVIVS